MKAIEPYPTSLRIVNWIKCIVYIYKYKDEEFINNLYSQHTILPIILKYDILKTILLIMQKILDIWWVFFFLSQLGKFSLFGIEKGRKIFVEGLNKQILNDGGHIYKIPFEDNF